MGDVRFKDALLRQFLMEWNNCNCGGIDGVWGQKSDAAWKSILENSIVPENELAMLLRTLPTETRAPYPGAYISPVGFALIFTREAGSPLRVMKRGFPAEVPSNNSGVTVGIGYDLAEEKKSQRDLPRIFAGRTLNRLLSYVGMRGPRARMAIGKNPVTISFDEGVKLFTMVTLPRLSEDTWSVFKMDRIPLDAAGALMSLVYNRGTSLSGELRSEMAEIAKILRSGGDVRQIPDLLRSMKRLWPDLAGVREHREWEARIFEESIDETEKGTQS